MNNNNLDKWNVETLNQLGIDHSKLTKNQIDIVLLPWNAPENYMQDGEINDKQAMSIWKRKLTLCGIDNNIINRLLLSNCRL